MLPFALCVCISPAGVARGDIVSEKELDGKEYFYMGRREKAHEPEVGSKS